MQKQTFTVTKVPANPPAKKLLRVAAYGRVSADKDAAFHSLEQQVNYYGDYVSVHPDWELVQIYSEGCVIIPLTRKVLDFQGFAPIDSTFHSTIRQKVINEMSRSMSPGLPPFRHRPAK